MLSLHTPCKPAPMLARGALWLGRRGGATAFGNAIGSSVADSMSRGVDWSQAPDQSDAETARLTRQNGELRDAEYLQQSDAILNRKAADAWTATREHQWIDQDDAILRRKAFDRLEGINGMDAQSDAWVAANGTGKVGRKTFYGGLSDRDRASVKQSDLIMARRGSEAGPTLGGGRSTITDPAAYIDPLSPHSRYKGVSVFVGDAFAIAEPVLQSWRNGRPVNERDLVTAFDALATQGVAANDRFKNATDVRAPLELIGINARLTWLSMAASRNGIELTPEQNMLAFGASLSLPIGENDFQSAGMKMPPGAAQRTRYTITNALDDGANGVTGKLPNLNPSDPAMPGPRYKLIQTESGDFKYQLPSGELRTPKGAFDFIQIGSEIRISPVRNDGFSTHLQLSKGSEVDYAGSIQFSQKGALKWWDNSSGHYQPPAAQSRIVNLPTNLFKPISD